MHDLPHFEIAITEMVQVTPRAILISDLNGRLKLVPVTDSREVFET
jgi:hypothetical protein